MVEVGFGSIFLVFLSLFEWVLLPSISNSLYLYSSFSEKTPVILGSFAAIMSLTALVVSSHALRKKFHNKNDENDGTYAEKIGVNLLFIAISGTNFAISTGAVSSQGTVLIAGYLLLLVSFLIYKRSQDGRGMISQIRNVNLGCQAICFLWLASMLQNNLFADNLTDSIITVLIVTLDPVFILIELILLLKYPLPNDHG